MIISSHSEKYKTVPECAKVLAEGEHSLDDENAYRSDVDLSQRYRNFISPEFRNSGYCVTKMKTAERICEESTGRKIRKDAVRMFSTVTSFPKSWPDDAVKELAEELYNAHTEVLKKAGMAVGLRCGYVVHFDEKSPHMHEYDIPVTSEKKLSCKSILSRTTLSAFHKAEYEVYKAFAERHPELEKMESYTHGSARQHLGTQAFKKRKLEQEIGDLSNQKLDAQKKKSGLQKETEELELEHRNLTKSLATQKRQIDVLKSQKLEAGMAADQTLERLEAVQSQLRRLDEDVAKREKKKREADRRLAESQNKRAESERALKAIKIQVEPLRALEREISASKASYDEVTSHADEDAEALRSAFADSKEVTLGKHRGLLQLFVPKGTYERIRTLAEKAEAFTRAYDAVSGLASRVEAVLDTAKGFYQKAKAERERAESIVSGDAYRNAFSELKKVKADRDEAMADRAKAEAEARQMDAQYSSQWEDYLSLTGEVDSLERKRDSLADELDGVKAKKYEHQFAQAHRDDFEDFVADQKRRERARDDDFWER